MTRERVTSARDSRPRLSGNGSVAIDLARLGYARIAANQPYAERGIV